jgi:hypothetical protein
VAAAHFFHGAPIARTVVGISISEVGFVVQLAVLVAGVFAIHAVPHRRREILIGEGALCIFAWGLTGVAFAIVLVGAWALLEARALGRLRFAIAAIAIAVPSACTWIGGVFARGALVFCVMFAMRCAVYAYERWQDDTPVPLADYLAYMLVAPLIVIPPYMAFIPLFGGFAGCVIAPSSVHLRTAARHVVWAAVFAGVLVAYRWTKSELELPGFLAFYGRLGAEFLDFAALVHLVLAALLVHGVELSSPIDRPAAATSFLELWRRFGRHLRDAQLFLFYSPALLRLRHRGRYTALVLATAWTMIIGNTLVHVAIRYCFLPDPWSRIGWSLVANTLMAVALAVELCIAERRRHVRDAREPSVVGSLVGWASTMTLAATVLWL